MILWYVDLRSGGTYTRPRPPNPTLPEEEEFWGGTQEVPLGEPVQSGWAGPQPAFVNKEGRDLKVGQEAASGQLFVICVA